MENPESLASSTESFSYGWLINTQSTYNINPTSFRKEYEDMNFNFDFPVITSPTDHFVHADEIFSNGQIKAAYDDVVLMSSQVKKAFATTNSVPSSPPIPIPIPLQYSAASGRRRYYVLEKWRKSSKRILRTCLGFVCKAFRSKRVDDLGRKVLEASRDQASPTHSLSSPFSVLEYNWTTTDYCKKFDSNLDAENSIREAILYCKRSIEK